MFSRDNFHLSELRMMNMICMDHGGIYGIQMHDKKKTCRYMPINVILWKLKLLFKLSFQHTILPV